VAAAAHETRRAICYIVVERPRGRTVRGGAERESIVFARVAA
jgi:hypothetical protein